MRHASACVLSTPRSEFVLETVEIDEPKDDEVLIRILGAGICHTDMSVQDGDFPFPMPAVLGHEGAGVVAAIGRGVRSVKPGDSVVLSFRSCGACGHCTTGTPAYCEHFLPLNFAGARPDGSATVSRLGKPLGSYFFGQSSFASYAVAHMSNVVPVESDLPLELLGPLGCGIQTGAGAVMTSFACPAGSSLLIVGGGAVGLSAVLGAVVQDCGTIIVSEPHVRRRELALRLGASHAIDPAAGPLVDAVRALAARGVDFVLDTTANPLIIEAAMACLATRGVCGLVGTPKRFDATVSASMALLVGGGRRLQGILEGDSNPQLFIPELLHLYRAGRFPFDKLITTYPMSDVNRAVADQRSGQCVKPVLLTAGVGDRHG